MDKTSDTAAIIAPPPVLFFGCLGLGYLLYRFVGVQVIPLQGFVILFPSWALFISSFVLAFWSIVVLLINKTPVDPKRPTLQIVQKGPFRFSRNPMYLSLIILQVGIAIFMGSLWMLMMVPVLVGLLHYGVVVREEQYLTVKFGDEYQEYCHRVRRWI